MKVSIYVEHLKSKFNFVDDYNPQTVFWSVITFYLCISTWEIYLAWRQRRVIKQKTAIPDVLENVMTYEKFTQSRLYALEKNKFTIFHGLFEVAMQTAILVLNILPKLWSLCGDLLNRYGYKEYEVLRSMLFILIAMTFSKVISIPWSLYFDFVIEEKYGFNKQTISFFIKDTIKKFIILVVILLPIGGLIVKIIDIGGDFFFIYAWIFTMTVSFLLILIYPDFIAPLFDKFTPLRDGELKRKIEDMTAKLAFPLYKVYVVNGSKRSAHSNAYFYGFFNCKRIVLYDTLLEDYKIEDGDLKSAEETKEADKHLITGDDNAEKTKEKKLGCSVDEVLAVLGHELGHWKYNHITINIMISFAQLLFCFLFFALMHKRRILFIAFGFTEDQSILIGLLITTQFLLSPIHEINSFLLTVLQRRFEFQADEFGAKLNNANNLTTALIKLEADNLSFPYVDKWFSTWNYSHPPLLQRIERLHDLAKEE